MRRSLLVGMLVVLALASLQMVGAGPTEQEQINALQTQVSDLRAIHGLTETATIEPTATDTPAPTATPEPTATLDPEPITSAWHSPTDHEHGDAPPAWAEGWSTVTFGHGVVFGGDESTPGENANKHNAFKGYAWTATADDGQPVDLYLRIHMQTNPLGRSAQFHSYEFYAARDSEVLGFWQGWLNFGASPDNRDTFADGYLWNIIPQYDPANHIVSYHQDGNPYYVASYSGREFWYSQLATDEGWEPVVIVDVYDPSTYTNGVETGDFGLARRVTLRWIVAGSTATTVSGQPYVARNMLNPRGWFCSTPTGTITSMGSPSCAAGSLPQWISPDMPTIGDTGSSAQYSKLWDCPSCATPN